MKKNRKYNSKNKTKKNLLLIIIIKSAFFDITNHNLRIIQLYIQPCIQNHNNKRRKYKEPYQRIHFDAPPEEFYILNLIRPVVVIYI